jgi:predicted histone-like DNA-binding protein
MAIEFRPLQIKNPFKPGEPGLFYPNPVHAKKVHLRDVAEYISQTTLVSSTDVIATLNALMNSISHFLGDGYIVDLENFGTFRIMLKSEGSADAKDVTMHKVKGKKLIYRPGKEFRDKIKQITVSKSKKIR